MGKINYKISYAYNNKLYTLNHTYLYLDDDYISIYKMDYLDNIFKEDIPQFLIRDAFSEYNMLKYFGSNANLSCKAVRILYEHLINYFIPLMIKKFLEIKQLNISTINENDPTLCILAECCSLIRSLIKKYVRNRTRIDLNICSKKYLEKINIKDYGCDATDEFCPSFNLLRTKRHKSCKQIMQSSTSPNEKFTQLSKLLISRIMNKGTHSIPLPNKPVTIASFRNKTLKSKKSNNKKTRKVSRKTVPLNTKNFFQIL